ncbi:hypothetical protein MTO96_016862 [Rhipicephalus appendiculatus]
MQPYFRQTIQDEIYGHSREGIRGPIRVNTRNCDPIVASLERRCAAPRRRTQTLSEREGLESQLRDNNVSARPLSRPDSRQQEWCSSRDGHPEQAQSADRRVRWKRDDGCGHLALSVLVNGGRCGISPARQSALWTQTSGVCIVIKTPTFLPPQSRWEEVPCVVCPSIVLAGGEA